MNVVDKPNLREFLFYEGTIISNPKDVNLEDNVFVVYSQRAYTIDDPELLEDIAYYSPEDGDILYSVPKDKL